MRSTICWAQMAEAGSFFLTLSGGEPLLRKDLFAILRRARELTFNVKLKTNAILIQEKEAALIRDLGVENVQISIYSHRPEVHDAITKVPGSLNRSIKAIRFLVSQGLKVTIANVLMRGNRGDYPGVQPGRRTWRAHSPSTPRSPRISTATARCWRSISTRADLKQVMRDPTWWATSRSSAPRRQPPTKT